MSQTYLRLHTYHFSYTQPTYLIFSTVIDIVSIFCHTKNQVGGSCVGEVSKKARQIIYYRDAKKWGKKIIWRKKNHAKISVVYIVNFC